MGTDGATAAPLAGGAGGAGGAAVAAAAAASGEAARMAPTDLTDRREEESAAAQQQPKAQPKAQSKEAPSLGLIRWLFPLQSPPWLLSPAAWSSTTACFSVAGLAAIGGVFLAVKANRRTPSPSSS